ncbi:arsenate reductase ArsC [Oceanisphaera avium]|uniref:Low molecular weight phosphatase family protein n=1 Tax=Oceanisphaera avium TaxID=1903694 RepID=A0A1Y0CWW7_9GAMM|nr:arsenate reductase ArsC [Oceanisphaera avium]ART79376.1 low molecular weight phosphatase family protein [Oceanisphaera avium]
MKILYICTHNRCRSILSEALTNHYGQGLLIARSAGSQPVGEVHPLTLFYLQAAAIATGELSSQSWDDLAEFAPDVVVTVCDSAAAESCPVWFGQSQVIHWPLADPSKINGSDEQVALAFGEAITHIKQRVEQLLVIARQAPEQWPDALALLSHS